MKKIFTKFFMLATLFLASTNLTAQTYNNGTWYSLYDEKEHKLEVGITSFNGEWEFLDVFPPAQTNLTFDAKRSAGGSGTLNVAPIVDEKQQSDIFSANPGKVTKKNFLGIESKVDYTDNPYSATTPTNLTQLKFYTPVGATLSKYFKNIKLPLAKHILLNDGTSFGTKSVEKKFANSVTINETSSEIVTVKLRSFLTAGNISITSDNPAFYVATSTYAVGPNACASANGAASSMAGGGTLGHINHYDVHIYFHPTSAGSHSGTITLTDGTSTATIKVSGICKKQAQTITWNDDIANIKTTDNITLNATATTAISYTSSDNSIAEIVGNTLSIKKHGKVTITATAAETDIYASASQTKEVTISAAAPEVTSWPKVTPITYGTPLTLDMLVGGNANVPGNFECAELPTTLNAGTHKISVRFVPENQNIYTIVEEKIDIIVKKADATITTIPNAINDLAYSGEEQTLITEGSAEGGKIVYSLDGNTFTENVPTATNAEEYTVYYKVVGDENHNDVAGTNTIVVTIKKATLTITAEDKSVTYGEEAPTYSATYSGWKAQDNEEVLVGEMTFECEYNTNSNVGTYDINISGVEAQNYEITFVSGVLTVNKADATITNTPNAINDLVYSGEEQTLITGGSAEGGEIVYSLDGNTFTEDVPTAINAGEYTVYYKVIGDENHNDVEETNSIVVIIKKATQSITWNDNIENIQTTDNITLNAIANTDIYYTSSDSTVAYVENKTLIINKYGVVTITAITKESNNYTQAIESKDITINRATPSITWNISDTLIVGNSIHLDAVASNNAEVLYEIIGEEDILKYDNQAKTLTAMAAGTTTILAYTEENDIYNAAEYQYTITVVLDSNPSTNITNTTINGEKAQKIFVNGKLYIIRNNQWYDTTGKLVK